MRQIVLFIHLFAAVFWIGEMIMVGLVIGPVSRRLDPKVRNDLFRAIGRASLPLAWGAIGILIVTGILNIVLMGIPLWELTNPAFYASAFGRMLGLKLVAVLAMFILSAIHDFVVARRAARIRAEIAAAGPEPPAALIAAAERQRRLAMRIGRINFVLAILVLFFAAGLVIYG